MIRIIQKYGIEYLGRYYSIYRGYVMKNGDPDHLGRILVSVPGIASGIKVWARPGEFHGGTLYGSKGLTPQVGEVVYVEFEYGDPMRPIWYYHGWGVEEVPEELQDNNTVGLITPSGNKVYLKEEEGLLKIFVNEKVDVRVKDGCSITMDKEQVVVNGGDNREVMNIDYFESFVDAVLKDLLVAQSGQNVAKWMADDLPKLPDKRFKH